MRLAGAFLYQVEIVIVAQLDTYTHTMRSVQWLLKEGEAVSGKRVKVAIVTGKARNILLGERAALNMLARASGIATRAREFQQLKETHKFKGVVAGTRKTTPGLCEYTLPSFVLCGWSLSSTSPCCRIPSR